MTNEPPARAWRMAGPADAGLHGFSFLGGPLHRLGRRLGLVRGPWDTVALGLALGATMWTVLLILSLIDGLGAELFTLSSVGAHVRLLVALPLFFVCEAMLDPRINKFVQTLLQSGVVPAQSLPAFNAELARVVRWKDSWLHDGVCLGLAMLISLYGLPGIGIPSLVDPGQPAVAATLAGQWYLIVCLTVFRFLILRWLWRIGLWCHFLWRLSRLDLNLVPTHPDGQAGLGYLQTVHAHFTPLIVAFSAVQSASFAQEIGRGAMAFEALGPAILLVIGIIALVFLGPLLILAPRLWAARLAGLEAYMVLGSHYVNAFDSKWLRKPQSADEPLLGSADLQSLADLQNSLRTIEAMQWIPVGRRLWIGTVAAVLLPMVPLLLLKYPFVDLIQNFIARLVGT